MEDSVSARRTARYKEIDLHYLINARNNIKGLPKLRGIWDESVHYTFRIQICALQCLICAAQIAHGRDISKSSTVPEGYENLAAFAHDLRYFNIVRIADRSFENAHRHTFFRWMFKVRHRTGCNLHRIQQFHNAIIDIQYRHVTSCTAS